MILFILIHEQDTDSAWGSSVLPFIDRSAAQDAMRQAHVATVKAWDFDETIQSEEHESYCNEDKAVIRDDTDMESWRIEEHEVNVEIAIEVKQGLVQAIYANTDVYPDVYDLDVPDYAGDGELEETDTKKAALEKLKQQPGWRSVY